MLYSLCGNPGYVSSCRSVVAADVGSLKDLESGESSGTKRISRISSWCTSSLFGKSLSWLSRCGLAFYYLIFHRKYPPFVFWLICKKYNQICACAECELLPQTSYGAAQKRAQQTWGKFCFPTGFSASFPDILFPHSEPSLQYAWVCKCVCVCECVSCVASGVNAQKPGWAVLKARGRGAAEGFCDNPWNQGEGERVFIWID